MTTTHLRTSSGSILCPFDPRETPINSRQSVLEQHAGDGHLQSSPRANVDVESPVVKKGVPTWVCVRVRVRVRVGGWAGGCVRVRVRVCLCVGGQSHAITNNYYFTAPTRCPVGASEICASEEP